MSRNFKKGKTILIKSEITGKQSIKKLKVKKKMKNNVVMGLAAIVMVAILSGCGTVPQEKIDAANAAIANAQTAEAAVYLPAEFSAVQDSMKAVMAEVEVQNGKIIKKFGPVSIKLDETLAAANQVAANAAVKKEEVKKEVETLMTQIKAVIEENVALVKKAPRGKEGAAVLAQIKTEMATIEASVTEAQGLYDNGAFMDADNKVKAAKARADDINAELKAAIAKVRR